VVVDLPCDVALEAPDGLLPGESFLRAPLDVVTCPWIRDHSRDDDVPERGVGLAVPTSVETVALVLAAAGIDRAGAAEVANVASVRSRCWLSPASMRAKPAIGSSERMKGTDQRFDASVLSVTHLDRRASDSHYCAHLGEPGVVLECASLDLHPPFGRSHPDLRSRS